MYKIGLLVYDYSLHGGAEKVALNLANEFATKYEVHFISCFSERQKPIVPLDERVKTFVVDYKTQSLTWNALKLSGKLKKYLLANSVHLLINITAGINTIGVLATAGTDIKLIYAEHSNLSNQMYGKKHQFRQWIGAKRADYIVTLTQQDKQAFIEKYHIEEKCQNIYNWYDGQQVSKCYDTNSKKIITVGRLVPVKGYDRLLTVAQKVFACHPEWTWDIYGEGPLLDEMQKEIIEKGLESNVFLKGNRKDIMDLYKQYAFLVMTSYYEGFPLVLLEAKSSMLPIVSFDCPTGPREIVTDEHDGFLIENGDIDKMAVRIIELMENTELRRQYSKRAIGKLDTFQKSRIAREWISLIDKLCKVKE